MESHVVRALREDSHLEQFILASVSLTDTTLGRGSYGSVLEVRYKDTLCAAKKMHDVLLDSDNEGVDNLVTKFKRECELMASLRHPNVTHFVGVWFPLDGQWPLLVMERLDMSLDDALVSVPEFALGLKLSVLCDVLRGLEYLHHHIPPIVHRDLTAKNVLLTSTLVGKITDLGNSRKLGVVSGGVVSSQHQATMTRAPGTLVYMAPEAISEMSRYGPPLDVFSFGHLALYTLIQVFPSNLLSGTYPDPNNPDRTLARSEVQRREAYFEKADSEYGRLHPSLLDLVKQCLHNAPGRRPSSNELLAKLEKMNEKVESESESGGVALRQLEISKVMLTKELGDKRRRVQELEGSVHRLQSENIQLKEKAVSMETEARATDRHLWSLRQDYQHRERELQEKVSELMSMETRLREQLEERDREVQRLTVQLQIYQQPATTTTASDPTMEVKSNELCVVWEKRADMPIGMSGYMQSVVVESVVYVGGGHTNYVDCESIVMAYDSSTGKWSKLPRYFARRFAMAVLDGQLVLVGGCNHGYEDTNLLGVWYSVRREWSHPYSPMPTLRSDSSAVGWHQWLLVAGGMSVGHSIATVEVMDTANGGQWSTAPSIPTPWTSMRSAVLESTWYLLGGYVQTEGNTDQMFSVSIPSILAHVKGKSSTGKDHGLWTVCGGLGYKIATPLSLQGSLYALGGIRVDDQQDMGGIHYYSLETSSWEQVGELPVALYNCTCSVVSADQLLLAGGYYNTVVKFFVSISKSMYIGKLR